jgi:4-amino-4-deoxy-L-arabinose transferase-like glycosyltransferase
MNTRVTTRRAALAAAALSAAAAVALIAGSWSRLSTTIDEPNHLAAGLEWLQHGRYSLWTENPPLARVAVALGPFLAGARLPSPEAWRPATSSDFISWRLGADALYRGGSVAGNLAQARAGTLPFFLLVVLLTGLLAARAGGWRAGSIAAIVVATLPAMMGNAAVATTDVAFVAMVLLALWALLRWLERPGHGRAAALGVSAALAMLTKFTAVAFLPIAAAALVTGAVRARAGGGAIARDGWRPQAAGLALAAVLFAGVLWAGYRFSWGRADDGQFRTRVLGAQILNPPAERQGVEALFTRGPLPAPALFHGLLHVKAHNRAGHSAFLLGETRQHGFRLFYPLALLFKTPFTFMALTGLGFFWLLRHARERGSAMALALGAAAVGILLVLVPSQVNLGTRHALIVYPLLAAGGAAGIARLLAAVGGARRRLVLAAAAALLVVQQATALAAYPNHLSYFNALAGSDPSRILDSADLDWGQGLLQLEDEARRRGVDRLQVALWAGFVNQCRYDLPPLQALEPHRPVSGWVAISEGMYSGRIEALSTRDPCDPGAIRGRDPRLGKGWFRWLAAHQPVWHTAGIRLYRLNPR